MHAPGSRVTLVTGPEVEPVTLAQVKANLKITSTSEDTRLTELITAARELIEGEIRRAMIDQVWEQRHNYWPAHGFKLARGKVLTLTSITYVDEADASDTFDTANVDLATWEDPLPRVTLKSGLTWPTATLRPHDGIILRFTAGYGDTASTVPADLRQAVIMATAALYDGCAIGDGPMWNAALNLAYKYTVPRVE